MLAKIDGDKLTGTDGLHLEDSLLIWSPGMLPFDITIEDLLNSTHSSRPRNKMIAQIFYDLGIIERYGGGMQRIFDYCADAGIDRPSLEHAQGGFRMIVKAATPLSINGGASEGIKQLLELISSIPGIQTPMISERMNTSPKNIERWIKKLKEAGKIEHRGSRKTGGYFPL